MVSFMGAQAEYDAESGYRRLPSFASLQMRLRRIAWKLSARIAALPQIRMPGLSACGSVLLTDSINDAGATFGRRRIVRVLGCRNLIGQ